MRFFGLALILTQLNACAFEAETGGMVAKEISVTSPIAAKVEVHASGGESTHPWWKSNISSRNFELAIQKSIEENGVFKLGGTGPTYTLDAEILETDHPYFGLDFEVRLKVRWTLVDQRKQSLWKSDVSSDYKATFSDTIWGVKRLRLAKEGAARANIRKALLKMSRDLEKKPGLTVVPTT